MGAPEPRTRTQAGSHPVRDSHPLYALLLLPVVLLADGLGVDARAQQPAMPTSGGSETVDRVVAVVADTAILLSEVREEVFRRQQQGVQVPQEPAARDSFYRAAMQSLIDERLLLKAAQERSVTVSDQQVDQLFQDRFGGMRSRFPSQEAFRDAVEQTGQNMFQFRQMIRSEARKELITQSLRRELQQSGDLPPAEVTEEEIRRYFEQRAAGQQRPGTVSFERVMVAPQPDSAALDSARRVAVEALESIRGGTDFAVAARRYSDDETSRERGGDLGWVSRSELVPDFARAAWRAPPGTAVGPVRSRFGWHVLEIENVRGGERKIRHVLVRPAMDEANVQSARERAEALADSLRQGTGADRLARERGLPDEQVRFRDLRLDELQGRMGDAYVQALTEPPPSEGDVRGPFQVEGSYGLPTFVVARVNDFSPTGDYRLEDVRDQIRENLMQQKQFQKYVEQLRERMHVRVLL